MSNRNIKCCWRCFMSSDKRARRDFLRLSGVGMAGAALPSRLAVAQATPPATHNGVSDGKICDVRTFDATGDGKTLDTPAINRAIEVTAAAGGGTVRFPAGNYLCYSIRLKSNVALCLDQNALIIAADPPVTAASSNPGYDLAEPNTAWDASRILATTTGTTVCSGARALKISLSLAPASSGVEDSAEAGVQARLPSMPASQIKQSV